MPMAELMLFDPAVLLQELYARESLKIGAQNTTSNFLNRQAMFPYFNIANTDGKVRFVPELSDYPTIDIISALWAQQKTVYGIDARTEMYMVSDISVMSAARRVRR